jgi:hypothetical protein
MTSSWVRINAGLNVILGVTLADAPFRNADETPVSLEN